MTQRRIYQEEYPYFVTFRTWGDYPLFEDGKMAELLANEIVTSARIKRYDVLAWQIMPEHAHVLVYSCDRSLIMPDRTLENVRSVGGGNHLSVPERPAEAGRSHPKNMRSDIPNTMRSHL